MSDTAIPMVLAAFSYWGVGLGSGIGLAFAAGMQGAGLWLGFVFGLFTAAVMLTMRFHGLTRASILPAVATDR